MPSATYDLGYLHAGLEEIESYLVSKNLFWPLNTPSPKGEPTYKRLTLGGMLLSITRLKARKLSPQQNIDLQSLESAIHQWRVGWRELWLRKSRKEFISRLRQWAIYLGELRQNPEVHGAYYTAEIRSRVILYLLKREIDTLDETLNLQLNDLDFFLHSILKQGEFVWDAELAQGFPRETYWYLWGEPRMVGSFSM